MRGVCCIADISSLNDAKFESYTICPPQFFSGYTLDYILVSNLLIMLVQLLILASSRPFRCFWLKTIILAGKIQRAPNKRSFNCSNDRVVSADLSLYFDSESGQTFMRYFYPSLVRYFYAYKPGS